MKIYGFFFVIFFAVSVSAPAQSLQRDFRLSGDASIEITNLFGRVEISSDEAEKAIAEQNAAAVENAGEVEKTFLTSENAVEGDLRITLEKNRLVILVQPANPKSVVNLILKIPPRMRVAVETGTGEIRLSGNFAAATAKTETGTIAAAVPLENLRYEWVWTESRPRFLSDVELKKVKEKAGGKFVISGRISGGGEPVKQGDREIEEDSDESKNDDSSVAPTENENTPNASNRNKTIEKKTGKRRQPKTKPPTALDFRTARGIVLLNVPLNEVSPDLRERPLTEAAKAIVRSGDGNLTEAIRRASPKFFGDYARTLPPSKREPVLRRAENAAPTANAALKKVSVRVTDLNNRTVSGLRAADFEISESGEPREILSIEPTTAPFNLVLLLDVSGSIDNYVDFLRKAARQFVETAAPNDRIAIIIFNEDVKSLTTFTSNKARLSESLDTFDAGGGTAFYDALGYTLTEVLRPLRGERTAIVVLTDGDDNRSFLPFDSLLGSIQESGALVYPLYIPSGLIAASATTDALAMVDPLRAKYMALTGKASGEGEKLARVSGGVYYPISRINQIQAAYEDIVVQLRTAYSITFRSDTAVIRDGRASPRLRIKVKRESAFVKIGSVVELPKESSQAKPSNFFAPRTNFFQQISFASTEKQSTNQITGEVEKIAYKQFVNDQLSEHQLENFDVNQSSGSFLLVRNQEKIAVSRWISPKRTRSYPYERVYNTLVHPMRVTVIPVLKDEGLGGDRDFLQWDTVSLMSLLDVFVVPAYYSDAVKNLKRNDQITAQKLDKDYVAAKLAEIFAFKGTAREWNERESKNLKSVFEKAAAAYREISKQTKTYLHDETALTELIKIAANPVAFAEFSRAKSLKGQSRELQSVQPKEALSTDTKGGVTITNLAGGKYYFTCDETRLENKTLFLIESKHSQRAAFTNENDIKDGLLKMMVYTNLKNVRVGKTPVAVRSVLRLTSAKLAGSISSESSADAAAKFFQSNRLSQAHTNLIKKLFEEAKANSFTIIVEYAEVRKQK